MTRVCPVCGKEFEPNGNNQKYCSEHCGRKKYYNNASTRKHNATLGPKERHRAYLAYGCKCAICGWQSSDSLHADEKGLAYGYGNVLHHINPCSKDGAPEDGNLILLCPNHHAMAHQGILSKNYLRKLTKPLNLTDDEVEEWKARMFSLTDEGFSTENPNKEIHRHWLQGIAIAGLLKRAGYFKPNRFWEGYINGLEWDVLDERELVERDILTMRPEYWSYLEPSKIDSYNMLHYIGGATGEALQALIDLDKEAVELEGEHMIDNYEELIG